MNKSKNWIPIARSNAPLKKRNGKNTPNLKPDRSQKCPVVGGRTINEILSHPRGKGRVLQRPSSPAVKRGISKGKHSAESRKHTMLDLMGSKVTKGAPPGDLNQGGDYSGEKKNSSDEEKNPHKNTATACIK